MSNREKYKRDKKYSTLQCEWYFEYLKKQSPVGTKVKYRHIGNGHNSEVWGYERTRKGTIVEWIHCENPYYLYKVKIIDSKNKLPLIVHPDLVEEIT